MKLISSNTLEIRRVIQKEITDGEVSYFENLQYRTKDVVIGILGISLGSWSPWQSLDRSTVVYVDENGNPI